MFALGLSNKRDSHRIPPFRVAETAALARALAVFIAHLCFFPLSTGVLMAVCSGCFADWGSLLLSKTNRSLSLVELSEAASALTVQQQRWLRAEDGRADAPGRSRRLGNSMAPGAQCTGKGGACVCLTGGCPCPPTPHHSPASSGMMCNVTYQRGLCAAKCHVTHIEVKQYTDMQPFSEKEFKWLNIYSEVTSSC